MADSTITAEVIEQQALKPSSVQADGITVQRRSVQELIAASNATASERAGKRRGFGLRFAKIKPGGAG